MRPMTFKPRARRTQIRRIKSSSRLRGRMALAVPTMTGKEVVSGRLNDVVFVWPVETVEVARNTRFCQFLLPRSRFSKQHDRFETARAKILSHRVQTRGRAAEVTVGCDEKNTHFKISEESSV